jgi:hypothetical protein
MEAGMTDHNAVLELINREIDGELREGERAELDRLLLADPAVRVLRDDLTRTCRALDAMPREAVPDGLHEAILAALPMQRLQPRPRIAHSAGSKVLFRYAAGFVVGLMVSTLAFVSGKLDTTWLDPDQLAGTLAVGPGAGARMVIDLDQVQGSILLTGTADAPKAVTSLQSSRPVSIVTRLHQNGMVNVEVVDDVSAKVLQSGRLRIEPAR